MPTRLTYRQAAARALGPFHAGTATSGSTLALVEATATPFKTSIASDERFENYHLYRPAAAADDKWRTVKTYDAANGQFTVDRLYAAAAYAGGVGEAFELLGVLDPDEVHRLVNETLKLTDVLVDVTFAPATNATVQHSLAVAAPWLDDPDRVYRVGYLTTGESFTTTDPYRRVVRGEPVLDGGVVYLTGFSLPTTATVYAKVARPAYAYCKASAGAYGDLTSGLTAETDEAVPQGDWVAAGVRMLAWDELRDMFFPGNVALAEREVARAADRFWALDRDYCRRPARTFRPVVDFGPSRGRARVVGWMGS